MTYKASSWWHREVRDKKILELKSRGYSTYDIAQMTHYGENTIREIVRHYKEQK